MSKVLTVVGATGTQGQSLINAALKDGSYKIRALTRDPSSQNAKNLAAKGVEVVKADINDEYSLVQAFKGSNAIFAMTNFFEPFAAHGPEKAIEIETVQGINIAKAASKTESLEHFVWSTLPNGSKLSNGKYKVPHSEAKNRVDDYIKKDAVLHPKTTFLWVAWYGSNYQFPMFTPSFLKTSGSYVQLSPVPADVPVKAIGDPNVNIGVFALAVLKQPRLTLPSRFVMAHNEETTLGGLLKDWSEVTGKPSKFVQTTLEDYKNVWPMWADDMGIMLEMWDELRDQSWSGESNILTKDDLGLTNYSFTTVKDAYAAMNWDQLL